MAVALPKRRLTVDDFHRMAESGVFGDDERLELWDGEIFEIAPIHRRHAYGVRQLIAILSMLSPDRAMLDVQNALLIDEHSQVSPDVMLLRPRDDGYRDLPTAGDVLLLIEVADATIAFDRRVKADRYAAAGVPEYWVVDVPERRVWTMTRPGPGGHAHVRSCDDGMLMALGVPVEIAALS